MKKKDESIYLGTFGYPDYTGIRKGVSRRNDPIGGIEYPYDKNHIKYAQGANSFPRDSYGRTSTTRLVPKNASDDWIDKEFEDASYMPGNPPQGNIESDEVYWQEGAGTPVNVALANKGGTGTEIPGAGGSWSSRPKGGHWDNEIELDKDFFESIFKGLTNRDIFPSQKYNPDHDIVPIVSVREPIDMKDKYDGLLFVGEPKFVNVGQNMKHSRMSPGLSWRENLKKEFSEIFNDVYKMRSIEDGKD